MQNFNVQLLPQTLFLFCCYSTPVSPGGGFPCLWHYLEMFILNKFGNNNTECPAFNEKLLWNPTTVVQRSNWTWLWEVQIGKIPRMHSTGDERDWLFLRIIFFIKCQKIVKNNASIYLNSPKPKFILFILLENREKAANLHIWEAGTTKCLAFCLINYYND